MTRWRHLPVELRSSPLSPLKQAHTSYLIFKDNCQIACVDSNMPRSTRSPSLHRSRHSNSAPAEYNSPIFSSRISNKRFVHFLQMRNYRLSTKFAVKHADMRPIFYNSKQPKMCRYAFNCTSNWGTAFAWQLTQCSRVRAWKLIAEQGLWAPANESWSTRCALLTRQKRGFMRQVSRKQSDCFVHLRTVQNVKMEVFNRSWTHSCKKQWAQRTVLESNYQHRFSALPSRMNPNFYSERCYEITTKVPSCSPLSTTAIVRNEERKWNKKYPGRNEVQTWVLYIAAQYSTSGSKLSQKHTIQVLGQEGTTLTWVT